MASKKLKINYLVLTVIIAISSINLLKCEEITETKNASIVFNNVSEIVELPTTALPNEDVPEKVAETTLPSAAVFLDDDEEVSSDNTTKKTVISSKGNGSNGNGIDLSKPKSCLNMKRQQLLHQPVQTEISVLKKCCPMGESLHPYDGPGGKSCNYENKPFEPTLISAALYEDCIEDLQEHYELEVEVGNPCNVSFIYTKDAGDKMFVMQNGSLLMMDEHGNMSYDIINDYCLDVDYESGEMMAIACVTPIGAHISEAQTILFAIFMMISVVCLIFVAYIHFAIRELRTVHGLSLGCMSLWLAFALILYIYAQLYHGDRGKLGYFVQFCFLSYFCWLVMLALNIVVTVWYFLPRYISITRVIRYGRLTLYGIISFVVPLSLVIATYCKRLNGMPSYFYQAWSESVLESQRYFIPPVSCCVFLTFVLLVISYFGFRNCDDIVNLRGAVQYTSIVNNRNDNNIPIMDEYFLEETKQDATCISILLAIISITWTLEVITFYSPGSDSYLAFMEIMNGLQGFFILMIFIVGRKRRTTIIRWWRDRGSHEITPLPVSTELKEIKLTS